MHRGSPKSRKIRDRLLARRHALLTRYRGENDRADELATHPSEIVDVANDQWESRVLSLLSDNDAHALANIGAAIERVDNDRYGICAACGTRIEPARLEALPEAAECAECARDAEQHAPRWTQSIG